MVAHASNYCAFIDWRFDRHWRKQCRRAIYLYIILIKAIGCWQLAFCRLHTANC